MNWESMAPVSAVSSPNDFGFNIRAVVGIAPSDTYGDTARRRPTLTGEKAHLSLADFSPIMPALPAHLVKASWLAGLHGFPEKITPEEIILQTYTLPLAAFQTTNSAFQLSRLQTIRFLFDGVPAGAVYLDEIGFSGQTW